jgi:hypothetical protein
LSGLSRKPLIRDPYFIAAFTIILLTIHVSVATFLRRLVWWHVGVYHVPHILSWIGSMYIAVYTPIYHLMKRRYVKKMKTLVNMHVFGNLLSFTGISIHFANQLGRPEFFSPEFGLGFITYIVTTLLVASGFLFRFRILSSLESDLQVKTEVPHYNRAFHISLTLTYYLILIFHITQAVTQ